MRVSRFVAAIFAVASAFAAAQQPPGAANSTPAAPSAPAAALTIYNENFAVARTTIALDLHAGLNEVSTDEVTTQLEPDSVVLRDLTGKSSFRVAEQDYDAAIVTQEWLLNKYEGKAIDFAVGGYGFAEGHFVAPPMVRGTIIRAPRQQADAYGNYQQAQPLIEVDGKMQFQMPGTPFFPASTDGLLLKPTLRWQIESEKAQKLTAELAYITEGLNWEATYNVVTGAESASGSKAAAEEEKADLVGWVTITNRAGTDFPQARIKLMAGDVAKIQPRAGMAINGRQIMMAEAVAVSGQVTQKAFDDYHLYDLNRTVSLANGETKQIQFLEALGVTVVRSYLYDGAATEIQPYANYSERFVQDQNYGLSSSNTKVQVQQEIKNTESNRLGIPLPAGRMRLYRRDADGAMEFVGESTIGHTPVEDTVKIVSGNAFDIKGSRRQTDFRVDTSRRNLDESFEVKLTNQKKAPVTVLVNERLYRGDNWEIEKNSVDYNKLDSQTVQFPVQVPAQGEATLTYTVHYTW